ncbi:MAG TPA: protein kinase, partial [Thermoanaerobaculia bacterium]|nr:protein kinase [Thermoanaerobaculia bacterium]
MSLSGTRLGPYEVLAPLGAGGMGEVYRARDTRLGRDVAIKVLPAGLAADPERLKRFEREARSASSLNHPNIVTIYDIGSEGGISYIAMELVKGEPLRAELVGGGALPVRQVLQIGTQIAEGLAKAHGAGIVHRDLKPENVMLTEDGHVKILDFGLAKLTQPDGSGGGTTVAPTVSGVTAEGHIVGTVGYMSPEQAVGGAVDYRSDQFSFGSILYEMATGRRAFQSASAPQTLAAIIQDEPESIVSVNPKVPAPLRWIVERCLTKEPRRRFASTEDLAFDLATVRDRLSEASVEMRAVPEAPAGRPRWWIAAVVAAGVLAAIGALIWRLRQAESVWRNPLTGARYTRLTDWESSELNAAISADGKFVAFVSDRDGPWDVWVAQVGSGAFVNLTKGNTPLSLSGGRHVGFSGDATQVSIDLNPNTSGAPRSNIFLAPTMGGALRPFLSDAAEASWSPDRQQILFRGSGPSGPGDPIYLADSNGGNRRQIHTDKPGIHNHFPTWSPDGRFVYFVKGVPASMELYRCRLDGGAVERLTNHLPATYPVLVDDRTVLYLAAREDSGVGLFALDLRDRISHPVTSGVEEYLSLASSGDGRRLVATVANPARTLWTAPLTGRVVDETEIRRFRLPTVRASKPRFGTGGLLYLS